MMAYKKTIWVNDKTPLNADNMNNIENGIAKNEEDIGNKLDKGTEGGPDVKQVVHNPVEIQNDFTAYGDIKAGIIGKATIPLQMGGQTIDKVECWVGEGLEMTETGIRPFYFALSSAIGFQGNPLQIPAILPICTRFETLTDYDLCRTFEEVRSNGFVPLELMSLYGVATLGDLEDINNEINFIKNESNKYRYQHTVHMITYSDATAQLNVSFTAISSSPTPVDSYQDLHEAFRGCNLTLSGTMKYSGELVPVYLDLHGGTISTDKIYAVDPGNAGAWRPQVLSNFPGIAFTDDVSILK